MEKTKTDQVKAMTIKKVVTLKLSYTADDEGAAIRVLRAALKNLLRAWRIKCHEAKWDDGESVSLEGEST